MLCGCRANIPMSFLLHLLFRLWYVSWDMVWGDVLCGCIFCVLMIFLGSAGCVVWIKIGVSVSAMLAECCWVVMSWDGCVSFCFALFLSLYVSYP